MARIHIRANAKLTPRMAMAWDECLHRADPKTGTFTVGVRTFARECHMHYRQMRTCLSRLTRSGDIKVTGTPKEATQITVCGITFYYGSRRRSDADMTLSINDFLQTATQNKPQLRDSREVDSVEPPGKAPFEESEKNEGAEKKDGTNGSTREGFAQDLFEIDV